MAQTFPYGYERPPDGGQQGMGTMLTWDQMMLKATVRNLHPEVRRRFKALIEFAATQGVPLGVGTAWRVQPNPPPPGFAQPGNSWHESCPVSPLSPTAVAIDTVPTSSWDWMERNCAAYGFRTFRNVNNEPWHIQPTEIPTGRKFATTMPPMTVWVLPGDKPPVPPQGARAMQYVIKGATGTAVYVTDWLTKRHIDGPTYDLFRVLSADPANGIRMNNGAFFEFADVIVDAIPLGHGPSGPDGPPADVIADEVAAELARRLVA
jgi:hypothetical protein